MFVLCKSCTRKESAAVSGLPLRDVLEVDFGIRAESL